MSPQARRCTGVLLLLLALGAVGWLVPVLILKALLADPQAALVQAVAEKSAAAMLLCTLLACGAAGWVLLGPGAQAFFDGATPETDSGPPDDITLQSLRADLASQAEQVQRLQRQTQTDAMTGLSLRHHFIDQLQRRLAQPHSSPVALLLVRIPDLEALNLRAGHATVDRLLTAAAHVLLTYVDRVQGAMAGRLNGSDFALCLPVAGVALETATSLRDALQALPTLRSAGARAVVGGVDGLPQTRVSTALAEADAALARAEAGEDVAVDRHGELVADLAGASAWRQQIAEALAEGRFRLEETPVVDSAGHVLHLACTLQLQLVPGAAYQPARRWTALARRSQLLTEVEAHSIEQALHAIEQDGQRRSVRLQAGSMQSPVFVAAVTGLLQTSPESAPQLAIELTDAETLDDPRMLAAPLASWQALGVRFGVLHAQSTPQQLPSWKAVGIRQVTVGAQHLRGIARHAGQRTYVQGLFALLNSLGLRPLAEGVPDPLDQALLWTLGLQGAADGSALVTTEPEAVEA